MKALTRLAQTTLWLASGSLVCFAAFVAPAKSKTLVKPPGEEKIDFNRDIRPILANKCLSCHGQDPEAVQGGLKLNVRASAISKLDTGHFAIVPGHPEQSEVIRRITSKDPDVMMPPPDSNKTLSDDDRATLRKWIVEGAEYKEHWGFVLPVRWPLPAVKLKGWVRNPIDTFALSKLESYGLKPSPEADKATMLRRVSLDITGLPPTPEELHSYLADKSPDAYEKEVDRLLASPRYAERMAMDWMDYARYADSNGYQSDWERFQWRWRDWVINAFNKNMPYNEFIIKQLAGDLLPHPTLNDRIATGFNRNHRINTEGGVIPEEWRTETVIDRVETTSEVFLGLTAGCARCHDHKYDPITQKDFYSLYAYFNNVPETGSGVEMPVNHRPYIKAPTKAQQPEYFGLQAKLKTLDARMLAVEHAHEEEAQTWVMPPAAGTEALASATIARYRLGDQPAVTDGKGPAPTVVGKVKFAPGRSTGAVATTDGAYLDLGNVANFERDKPFGFAAWINPAAQGGSAFSKMDTKADYRGWDLYMADNKPAVHLISKWPTDALKVISMAALPMGRWSHVAVTYDGSGKAAGVHIYIDGKVTKTQVETDQLKGSIQSTVTAKVGTRTGSDSFKGQVDDLAFFNRVLTPAEIAPLAKVNAARPLLRVPLAKRTEDQKLTIAASWSEVHDPSFAALTAQEKKTQTAFDDLDSKVVTVMVMEEMAKPRQAHVLIRGQYDHPGAKVYPRTPKALPQPPPGTPKNRLGLAEWIASPENPLTARVQVNRLWERCFGIGIVATGDDFGTRADFPSHPKLLDWLATEFVRLHWNIKAMLKEIVMSATYRQSSNSTPAAISADPANRLLARGPRFRLPAEVIRDQAIYEAGMLTEKLGGPSVRPYQPNGIWDDVSVYGNLHNYKHDVGPNLHRRSLYTFWKRTAPPPEMTLFDVPGRELCTMERARTDTPLQALVLLDDETFIEASRALAQKAIRVAGTDPRRRISYMFTAMTGREPTPAELNILGKGFWERFAHYQKDDNDADRLINIGDWPTPSNLDPAALAAYTTVASTILNLDETITQE
ncbi:MAG: DUF1553 domain-containing protein [Fimbriimonadaceae bacterium]